MLPKQDCRRLHEVQRACDDVPDGLCGGAAGKVDASRVECKVAVSSEPGEMCRPASEGAAAVGGEDPEKRTKGWDGEGGKDRDENRRATKKTSEDV